MLIWAVCGFDFVVIFGALHMLINISLDRLTHGADHRDPRQKEIERESNAVEYFFAVSRESLHKYLMPSCAFEVELLRQKWNRGWQFLKLYTVRKFLPFICIAMNYVAGVRISIIAPLQPAPDLGL